MYPRVPIEEKAERMDPAPIEFDDFGDFTADCPAGIALDLFASRWTSIIVYTLRDGPMRPGQLQAAIGGISHKVLTQTLRRMQRSGLVTRHRYAEAPPRVDYELTQAGRELLVPIYALGRWAHQHADIIPALDDSDTGRRQAGTPIL